MRWEVLEGAEFLASCVAVSLFTKILALTMHSCSSVTPGPLGGQVWRE